MTQERDARRQVATAKVTVNQNWGPERRFPTGPSRTNGEATVEPSRSSQVDNTQTQQPQSLTVRPHRGPSLRTLTVGAHWWHSLPALTVTTHRPRSLSPLTVHTHCSE